MRLELEKKNESQQFNEETNALTTSSSAFDHSYHMKANHHPHSNIELINQNQNLYTPPSTTASSTNQLDSSSYELKFVKSNTLHQANDIYTTTIESPSNNLTAIDNYNEFYDSADSGSSSYSETSDCTSEELDSRLAATVVNATIDNQTHSLNLNNLTFNLSPFSLIASSNVPTTTNELELIINNGANYDTSNQIYSSTANFLTDQSFRYYSSLNNQQQQQQQQQTTDLTTTTNEQLINNHHHHLHYPIYYQDATTMYNNNLNTNLNLTTTASLNYATSDEACKLILNNNNFNNAQQQQLQPFVETNHYTDLSLSIASKSTESISLLSTNNTAVAAVASATTVNNEQQPMMVIITNEIGTIVNSSSSSDDSSSSGQSTQNECEQEDNFGEIIKKIILVK